MLSKPTVTKRVQMNRDMDSGSKSGPALRLNGSQVDMTSGWLGFIPGEALLSEDWERSMGGKVEKRSILIIGWMLSTKGKVAWAEGERPVSSEAPPRPVVRTPRVRRRRAILLLP